MKLCWPFKMALDLSRFVKTNEVEESPHGEDINENEGEEERLT